MGFLLRVFLGSGDMGLGYQVLEGLHTSQYLRQVLTALSDCMTSAQRGDSINRADRATNEGPIASISITTPANLHSPKPLTSKTYLTASL